jgi:23S rRNA (cytosine1962-C5)-methyltransferase
MSRIPPSLTLSRAASDSVRRGHPWVWSKGLTQPSASLAPGTEVELRSAAGELLGRGIYEPDAPIAVRVWAGGPESSSVIDDAHVRDKLRRAFAARERLFADGDTNAYRLLHGEGDRTPGVVIDRYDHVAVVRVDGAAAEATATRFRSTIVEELQGAHATTTVLRRSERGSQPVFDLWGGPPMPATIVVRERGVPFVVDLARGQKTGAFLDQRDNRVRVGAMARSRRVLNLFSYAGGFSLHAALGGAAAVTSVDVAAQAHGTAQASFRAAGVDPKRHEFVSADVFAFLAGAKARGVTWDLVVSDPPSFAPSEKARPRALAAYRSLHNAAVAVVADGGTLCAASCSSHVTADDFLGTLDDAALSPRKLSLVELHGPPPDHPTLAAWPEGRYLKFTVLR